MRIYTKRGDSGVSDLFTGERRSKTDASFQALGDLDELNASLGVAKHHISSSLAAQHEQVITIQSRLFDVGSAVATPLNTASEAKRDRTQFDQAETSRLEGWIDELEEQLPPLTNFILPSGVTDQSVGKYLNRLSDYLFVLARFVAMKDGCEEVIYRKARN